MPDDLKDLPRTEKIPARKQDGVGWLTINEAEFRNAVSLDMWNAITHVCADFAEVSSVSGADG